MRIQKRIELPAPVARVWRALTDYSEFGVWGQADGAVGTGRNRSGSHHPSWL
jgi:uncharacterized protein YndB with AHSA1/START domain